METYSLALAIKALLLFAVAQTILGSVILVLLRPPKNRWYVAAFALIYTLPMIAILLGAYGLLP